MSRVGLELVKVADTHPMWMGVKPGTMLSDGVKGYVRESDWPTLKARLDSIALLRRFGVRVNEPETPNDNPPGPVASGD